MADLQSPTAPGIGNVDSTSQGVPDDSRNPTQALPREQLPVPEQGMPSPTAQSQPPSKNSISTQLDVASPQQVGRQGPYNMMPMANALPQVPYCGGQYPQGAHQRYNPATSPPMMSQMQMPQYGPSVSIPMGNQGFYAQHPPHMAPYYGGAQMSPTQSQSSMPLRRNMHFYPNQMMMGPSQSPYYYHHTTQYASPNQGIPSGTMVPGQYMPGSPTTTNNDPRVMGASSDKGRSQFQQNRQGKDTADRRQSAVRGPPRKPRQSGHSIWIGNLPPQTDLMSLVHHVCKETPGLESLFLISKSNCAFSNFKDELACVGAQKKIHDSKFQSVRLVSRLRKSTVEGTGGATAPTGPSASKTPVPAAANGEASSISRSEPGSSDLTVAQPPQTKINTGVDEGQEDKFFILKSLTVEDLERSVRTGVWATQPHNEEVLNNAFKEADNVYLVFSANKSGEYFGYGRMVSEINNDPDAAIEFAPKAQITNGMDLPKAIPTEATEFAPKGRIIDDSARGTIFWELDGEDSETGSDEESEVSTGKDAEEDGEGEKTWGKPFKLEWLSTNRLPFYRTRGLRNPWNSNREVKIARDGTEIEPSVGRRLIGLFNNHLQNAGQFVPHMGPAMGMTPGYPQMRPYGP